GLGGQVAVRVVGVGGGQPGVGVGVGLDVLADLTAEPVVGVKGDLPVGVGDLGLVAVGVVQGGGDRPAGGGLLIGQPLRRDRARVAARAGGAVGVGVRGGATGREPGDRRAGLLGELPGRIVGVARLVGGVGGRRGPPVCVGEHHVVARVGGRLRDDVIGVVGPVGGRAQVGRLVLAGGLRHLVAAGVVAGLGLGHAPDVGLVLEPAGVVPVAGDRALGVGLRQLTAGVEQVVGPREDVVAGVGDGAGLDRGQARGVLRGLPLGADLSGGQLRGVPGQLGEVPGEPLHRRAAGGGVGPVPVDEARAGRGAG